MRKLILLLAFCLCNSTVWAQSPKLVYPHLPVWRQAQDPLEFEVEGPPGQSPQLQVGSQTVPLEEVAPGKFRGQLAEGLALEQSVSLNGEVLGLVRTMSGPCPVFEVVHDQAIFRSGPDPDFDRYTPVNQGVRFEVVGREGDWLRVHAPDGYIQEKDVKPLPPGSSAHLAWVHAARIEEDPARGARVKVRLHAPCAWQIREELGGPLPGGGVSPSRLWIDFPGAPMKMHEMAFAPDSRRIPAAQLHPTPQGTRLELAVKDGLWGYTVSWDKEEMVLSLPAPLASGQLSGVRITLDAGHGGTDLGAPGPNGGHEKDYNFAVTRALQEELERAGAVVTMTRSEDSELTPTGSPAEQELSARVQVSDKSQAQLFISIHHNAMANLEAGRKAHGCHVYYFYPHSGALAAAVGKPLADAIAEPSYVHFWRSFHVIRQSGRPAILIECNFVSNPEVEKEILMKSDYPQKAARGIFRGVMEFLKEYGVRR